MSDLREALESASCQFPAPMPVWVGFSGGLDSLVLLLSCWQNRDLFASVKAVHINHQLSPYADAWAQQCEEICRKLDIDLYVEKVVVDPSDQSDSGLEAAARRARFSAFERIIPSHTPSVLLLAHHQNDQAETVLFRLIRGAGLKGLTGMQPQTQIGSIKVLRPFLQIPKLRLLRAAESSGFSWVNDPSNQDLTLSRNYLRQKVLPVIEEQWPAAIHTLSRTAQICHATQLALDELVLEKRHAIELTAEDISVQVEMCLVPHYQGQVVLGGLSIKGLLTLSQEVQLLVLRSWLSNKMGRAPGSAHLNSLLMNVLKASSNSMPKWEWANTIIGRYQQRLLWWQDRN